MPRSQRPSRVRDLVWASTRLTRSLTSTRAHRPHPALEPRHLHWPVGRPARPVRQHAREPRPWLQPGALELQRLGRRCGACGGTRGRSRSNFLPDVYVVRGMSTARATTARRSRSPIMARTSRKCYDMSATEALKFFADIPRIKNKLLQTLYDVGLGYIRLGQPATTLSGGEARRSRSFAKELHRQQTGRTFYILDEPTTGLHSRTCASCSTCCSAWSTRATPCWSSSTTSTSSRWPTASSTWVPRAATAVARWSCPARRAGGRLPRVVHGRLPGAGARAHPRAAAQTRRER